MVIGFVGLGIMGKPMAKNLCRAGYTLIVNDHHKENVDELVQAGARSGDLKQIGMESDVVITMLPNSPQVKDVMLGENGIAGYMKKGTCFIDMSSINPVCSATSPMDNVVVSNNLRAYSRRHLMMYSLMPISIIPLVLL